MRYKIVDERNCKGIILTAESLLDLRDDLERTDLTPEQMQGALHTYDFLKECYNKAHPSNY